LNYYRELLDRAGELSAQQLRDFGPALAWKYVDAQAQYASAQTGHEETGLEGASEDFALEKPATSALELVDWEQELVRGVLVDVDEDVKPKTFSYNKEACWMNSDMAFRLVMGEDCGAGEPAGRDTEMVDGDEMEE
jgi:hypothetical protein